MVNHAQPLTFAVLRGGPVAWRCFGDRAAGRVAAVFRAAFYIEIGSQLICIGSAALEPGPLNLITLAPEHMDWRTSGVRLHGAAAVSASEIRIGNQFRFPLLGAAMWSPDPIAKTIDPAATAVGLAAFREALRGRPIEDGLARFVDPGYAPARRHYQSRAAKAPLAEARHWLVRAFAGAQMPQSDDRRWIGRLTGLGAGLTPSGDDFLGGMMIALHSLGHTEICRSLWEGVRPCAERTTNIISLALLRAAAEGLGSASVHKSLSGILRGDIEAVHDSMPGLVRIGHSSGWDTLTGVVTVLDCWLQLRRASVA